MIRMRHLLHHVPFYRSNWKCEYCGTDLLANIDSFMSITVDHFLPKADGGRKHVDNSVSCCFVCNQLKGKSKFPDIESARVEIARRREMHEKFLEILRGIARKDETGPAGDEESSPSPLAESVASDCQISLVDQV